MTSKYRKLSLMVRLTEITFLKLFKNDNEHQ